MRGGNPAASRDRLGVIMKTQLAAIAATIPLALTQGAIAQDDMKPKKRNADYYSVLFVDFKPGKMDEARAIIKDYFARADEEAEINGPELNLIFMTGDWDMVVGWKMDDGLTTAEWETSPDDVKWMRAMGELAGGADGARETLDRFSSLVERSQYQMAYSPR